MQLVQVKAGQLSSAASSRLGAGQEQSSSAADAVESQLSTRFVDWDYPAEVKARCGLAADQSGSAGGFGAYFRLPQPQVSIKLLTVTPDDANACGSDGSCSVPPLFMYAYPALDTPQASADVVMKAIGPPVCFRDASVVGAAAMVVNACSGGVAAAAA